MNRENEKIGNAVIYFAKNTDYCHKLKLIKLLYYLDFWHFKETGKSVTGLTYKAWEKGPVATEIFYQLKPGNLSKDLEQFFYVEKEEFRDGESYCLIINPKKEFNKKVFSRRELCIIERVAEIFKEAKAESMTDATHLHNSPWKKTIKEKGKSAIIDYVLAFDDEKNSLNIEDYNEIRNLDNETREILKSISTE